MHPDDAVGVVAQHRGHVHARPRHVPGVRPEGEQVRADAVQHRAQLVLGLHPAADVRVQGGGDPLVAHRRAAQRDAVDDDLEPVRVEAVAHRRVGRAAGEPGGSIVEIMQNRWPNDACRAAKTRAASACSSCVSRSANAPL